MGHEKMHTERNRKALGIFFQKKPEKIAEEINSDEMSLGGIADQIDIHLAKPDDEQTDEEIAGHWHDMMLFAMLMGRSENLHEYEKLFYVVRAAQDVAEKACEEVYKHERLSDLANQIGEIAIREGLNEDEYWPKGAGPRDYEELSGSANDLLGKINDTILEHVLERYSCDELVALFNQNRMEFEIRYEAGRRSVFNEENEPSGEMRTNQMMDEMLKEQYGSKAIKLMRQRMSEIRRFKGE